MNSISMTPGIPYIVTRGSAALRLVAGHRVEVCRLTGALLMAGGLRCNDWRGYSFSVEEDDAGILEKASRLIAEGKALEARVAAKAGPE